MPIKLVDLPTSLELQQGSLATFALIDLWAPQ